MMLEDVLAAHSRIRSAIRKTPLLSSRLINQQAGCELFFKAEHLQTTGSFKARGALNFLLTENKPAATYTTYSSGNHGQALSWACARIGSQAVVFVPENANAAKVSAIEDYGGRVVRAGTWPHERLEACLQFAEKEAAVIVPPYEEQRIMAGQGTVMLEILEDLPLFDAALVPAGGGGLLAGCSLVLKTLRPRAQMFSAEPESAGDIALSLRTGKPCAIDPPETIADGVRHLKCGQETWPVFSPHVDQGLLCSEDSIRRALAMIGRNMKQVVEPTGAVPLATVLDNRALFAGRKVVVVLSGGNVDLAEYGRLVG